MAANTNPIFGKTPKNGFAVWLPGTTANTKNDGAGTIGTDMLLAYTAGTNGAYVRRIRLLPSASAASTATTATVARVYRSTQTTSTTTNANTFRIDEVSLPSVTADQATVGNIWWEIPIGIALAAGEAILVSMHHAAATSACWQFIVDAIDY